MNSHSKLDFSQLIQNYFIAFWQGKSHFNRQIDNILTQLSDLIKRQVTSEEYFLIVQKPLENILRVERLINQMFDSDPNARSLLIALGQLTNISLYHSEVPYQSVSVSGNGNQVITTGGSFYTRDLSNQNSPISASEENNQNKTVGFSQKPLSATNAFELNKEGKVLIVTVTKVEAQAVLSTFSQASQLSWVRMIVGEKTYYNLGNHGGVPVVMVQSEMGISTPGGALLTVRRAIHDLRPQAIIMCGIAYGLKSDKQHLGDILIAKQLQYYEPQKIDIKQGLIPRGDRTTVSERLLDRFRSGDNDWRGAHTHFGLIMSGEKLVNDPSFQDWLRKTEPEAIGGEMEGAGLYTAARDAKVDWILVKGICDWADGNKNDGAQSLAAFNAAKFVLHVIQLGGWTNY